MAHDRTRPTQQMMPDVADTVTTFLTDPVLLPGEDEVLFHALAVAIRKQLDPRNILQRLACDDIVNLRWEILRHRRFRQKSAERFFAGDMQMIYARSEFKGVKNPPVSEAELLAFALETISKDPKERDNALQFFEQNTGIDPEAVLADAYAEAPAVKCHDARLNILMRQHRQAMKDYEIMKAADARHDIPDAEIVKDAA